MRKLTQEITYLNKEDLLNILFKHFGINEATSSIHIEGDIYSEEFITIVIKETIHTEDIAKPAFTNAWGTRDVENTVKSLFKCEDCKDQGRWPGCELGKVCSLFVMKK